MNWRTIGYNEIRFIVPLYIATMFFFFVTPKRKKWPLYLPLSMVAYIVFCGLVSNYDSALTVDWFMATFLIDFIFAGLALFACVQLSLKEAFYYAMAAYLIQNLVDNSNTLIFLWSGSPENLAAQWCIFLIPYVVIYPLYYLIFVRRLRDKYIGILNNAFFLAAVILGLGLTYVLSMYSTFKEATPGVSIHIYAILATSFVLATMFNVFNSEYLKTENQTLESLLARQNDSNVRSQENYELISMRIHDIRHRIRAIKEQGVSPEIATQLEELEQDTLVFNNSVKTGNKSLDTILSEKSLYCAQNGIIFSCMADGAKLSFMSEADIYALFDNAIENAVEALKGVEEGKRTITISVKEVGEMLFLHFENYAPQPVRFINGLPQSSKNDASYHGYGTKSIAYLAKKYGGYADFHQENSFFTVNVCFPLSQK